MRVLLIPANVNQKSQYFLHLPYRREAKVAEFVLKVLELCVEVVFLLVEVGHDLLNLTVWAHVVIVTLLVSAWIPFGFTFFLLLILHRCLVVGLKLSNAFLVFIRHKFVGSFRLTVFSNFSHFTAYYVILNVVDSVGFAVHCRMERLVV